MEASERRLVAREAERLDCSIDQDALGRLDAYVDLLRQWNSRVRLLGDRKPAALPGKHLPDCLALVRHLPALGPVADIGSGAGLPGLVLACVRPDLEIWLVESKSRKASFLLEVKARLELKRVTVVASRAEVLEDDPRYGHRASAVTARAVSLEEVVKVGLPLLRQGGRLLAMQAQTRSPKDVEAEARLFGLIVLDVDEYHLLGGEGRRIVVLARS